MTATSPASDVAEVLRHHADGLVQVWRTGDEQARCADLDQQWAIQEFRQILGITTILFGVFFTGAGAMSFFVDIGMKDDAWFTAAGLLVLVFGVVTSTRARASGRDADVQLAAVLPFLTTPAAASAYRTMLGEPDSDHARAEQFRRALSGLPADRQVKQPEHAALLLLGHAASLRAESADTAL